MFAIPYEGDYTLIGTTEMDYTGDLASPAIAEREIEYLLAMANRYFASDLARKDVVWTFAGLRPLLADPKDRATSVTRDYVLDLDANGAAAAVDLRRQAHDLPQARRGRRGPLAPRLG